MADNINDSEEAEALLDKLYIMRKAGLEEVGEFSTENLAFKKVRDAGILERLKKMKKEKIDKQLSLESYNEKASTIDKVSNRGLYVALLEQPFVQEHLKKSVEARQADDPDAKVGDTIIDSDRLISLFSDKLKPSDYKDFNAEIAEELLFDELHKIEREYGFKENTDEDYDSLYDKVDSASSDLKELINELPQFFEESYKDGIYNLSTIGKALQMEKEFLDSVETVDGRADSIMSFIIPDGKTIEKTILTKRDKVKEYKPQENEYFLDMVRDTGWWTTDYNLAPMQTLVNRWNGIMESCENQRSGIMENYVQPYELYLYKKASPENQAKGEEYDLVKAPHFDTEQEMRDYLQGVKDQYDSYEMRKREKDGSLGYIAEDVATLTDKIDKADNDLEELLKNLTSSIHEALEEKTIGELKDEKLIKAGQLIGYGFNYDKYTPNELKAYLEKRLEKVTDAYIKERFQGALNLIKEYLGE